MSKPIPHISKYMTPAPQTIGKEQTLTTAHRLMREGNFRHLPVLAANRLVGLVSERDLSLVETLKDVDPDKLTVEEAMTPAPYTVSPEAPLDEVVLTMAKHRYGSAVVMDNHKVVGLFTTVDALAAFAELLTTRLAKS